jgi:glycosyltransferase involved in cell wall biosynthesis
VRIVFVIRSLGFGGAERQLVALAKGLRGRGHDVRVATFYDNGELAPELTRAQLPLLQLGKRGRWDTLAFCIRLVRVLREAKPDIVHGYLSTPNLLTIAFKHFFGGARIVWGIRASSLDLQHYDWFARMAHGLERRLARFADLIICNSHAGLDYAVRNGFPDAKTIVISNGIDVERFRPSSDARLAMRSRWGIAEREILVGMVARMDPMKDHETFLRAAARLARDRHDVRFVCVGEGPNEYRRLLASLAGELGLGQRVIWAGNVLDMPSVYNALDVFVSSSRFGEGFSNAVGEAMACGIPCIVTDVGDSSRIVGTTGTVVSPGSPDRLYEAMRGQLDLVPIPADAIRRSIIDRYGTEQLIAETESALSQLLRSG